MRRTICGSVATVLSTSESGSDGGSGLSEYCESRGPPTDAMTSSQRLLLPIGVSERVMVVCSGCSHSRLLSIEGQ